MVTSSQPVVGWSGECFDWSSKGEEKERADVNDPSQGQGLALHGHPVYSHMVVKGEQKVWVNISPCIVLQFAAERQRSTLAEVLGTEFPLLLRLTAPLR